MATLAREIPGYVGYFGAYEAIKSQLQGENGESSTWSVCVAGGLAGSAAWALSYPQDVIKSHIQLQTPGAKPLYKSTLGDGGFLECGRQLIRQGGWQSLFRGFVPCMLRSMPANAAGFLAYEKAAAALLGPG